MPITVNYATAYSPELAAAIGALHPELDPRSDGRPMPRERLERLIAKPDRDQLLAYITEEGQPPRPENLVGIATMNTIDGSFRGEWGQLEDFVVAEAHRGKRIAEALWLDGMAIWCLEQGLPGFELMTESYRERAIAFYKKMGAVSVEGAENIHFVYTLDTYEQRVGVEA